jgi:Fic family protein
VRLALLVLYDRTRVDNGGEQSLIQHELDHQYGTAQPFAGWAELPVRTAIWESYEERLRQRRFASSESEVALEIRRSVVATALNTGAIEGLHRAGRGLTVTVLEHPLDWQPAVRGAEGQTAADHVSAGLDSLEMALRAAETSMPVSAAWIRELHRVACAAQDTVDVVVPLNGQVVRQTQLFTKGVFKSAPNHVELADGSFHSYCPVADVPVEIAKLLAELASGEFVNAHPALQAAYAHYGLTHIHPFQDGNGRVARALAGVYLFANLRLPLLIYADQQNEYFDALEAADGGNPELLVRFVEDRTIDLMGLINDLSLTGAAPAKVFRPIDEMLEVAVDAGKRLEEAIEFAMREAFERVEVGPGVEKEFSQMGYSQARDQDGRRTILETHPYANFRVDRYGLRIGRWVAVFVSDNPDMNFPFSARIDGTRPEPLDLRLSDVTPSITTAAHQRIKAFANRVMQELLVETRTALAAR